MFSTYKNSLLLGLKQVTNYQFEAWFGVVTRLFTLAGLILLWNVIYKENPSLDIKNITAYLLIANAVKELVDGQYLKLSKEIMNEVKSGSINSQILRPVHPMVFYFFRFSGGRLPNLVIDLVLIGVGIFLLGNPNWLIWLIFLAAVMEALVVAYCFNIIVGSISFWVVDISGFRNVANHISRILSGSMIPISFFPGIGKYLVLSSPFPILSFTPAAILQNGLSQDIWWSLLITLGWIAILIPFSEYLWKKGLRNYEGIGI